MMLAEKLGDIEDDDEEGALGLEDVQNRGIFGRYHNSIVGNLGADFIMIVIYEIGIV